MWTMWQPENLLVGPRCTMCHMPPFREGQLVELHSQPPVQEFLQPPPYARMTHLLLCTEITSRMWGVDKE